MEQKRYPIFPGGLNRDAIKYFAIFTMLLNHIGNMFLPEHSLLYEIFLDIGYFTAITMCYFLVEGYRYTRSKKKYGIRLLAFAVISQMPFQLAFGGEDHRFVGFNMIFTLLVCFLILVVRERVANPVLREGASYLLMIATVFSDWPIMAAFFTILFSDANQDRAKIRKAFRMSIGFFAIFKFLSNLSEMQIGMNLICTIGAALGVVLSEAVILNLYNGKRATRGRNFSKWFFYLFYPGHLLLLYFLKR